jgi:hydroxypyruvate isomerase
MQQSLLAGGSLLTASATFANEEKGEPADDSKPFQCNYGVHDGMFKNHAGAEFTDQIKFAHSVGFRSIEDNGMMNPYTGYAEKDRRYFGATRHDDGCFCERIR